MHTTDSGFNYTSTILADLERELCAEHGWQSLKAYTPDKGSMVKVKIDEFIRYEEGTGVRPTHLTSQDPKQFC